MSVSISKISSASPIKESKERTKASSNAVFREFTESTTLHGIRKVFGEGSKIRRLIWLLCLLACTAIFLKNTINLISSYLSYDVVTRVTLVNQDFITFPAVTICNFNPLRKEYIERQNLTELMSVIRGISGKDIASNWRDHKIYNTSMQHILKYGAHRFDDGSTITDCKFQERDCRLHDFKPVYTRMGRCVTYNKGLKNSSFARIRNPGVDYGLKLNLVVQQDQYFGVNSFAAGFKIHIHGQDEPPLVKDRGFAVMPGASTFVSVSKTRVKSLPEPYKPNCENKKLLGTSVYSRPLCYEACRASFIMEKCGCRDAEMPEIPNILPCTFGQKVDCVFAQEVEFTKQLVKNCSCPTPCDLTTYNTRLSYAQYPSEHVKETLARHFEKRMFGNKSSPGAKDQIYKFMGENLVQINIFLPDLNYNFIEDIPKYQLESLLAEAGGMLGLLLGASVLTVMEFLDFLYTLFSIRILYKSKPR